MMVGGEKPAGFTSFLTGANENIEFLTMVPADWLFRLVDKWIRWQTSSTQAQYQDKVTDKGDVMADSCP